jgi:hypothetical protein
MISLLLDIINILIYLFNRSFLLLLNFELIRIILELFDMIKTS